MSSGAEKTPPVFDLDAIRKTLSNRQYNYVEELGRGAFSAVYKVISVRYTCEFAVKVSVMTEECCKADRKEEIDTLLSLSHPNIIRMYEHFSEPPYQYIVLEYCHDGSLEDYVTKHGPMRESQVVPLIRQICSALKFCHARKIAHRDIKPGNILLDQYGRPKIADFGLSTSCEQGVILRVNAGSRAFMPPEMIQRRGYDPFKADIWALGVTIYILVVGRVPWPIGNVKDMDSAITVGNVNYSKFNGNMELLALVKAMLTRNEANRPDMEWVCSQELCDEQAIELMTMSSFPVLGKRRSSISNRQAPLGLAQNRQRSKDAIHPNAPLAPNLSLVQMRRMSRGVIGLRTGNTQECLLGTEAKHAAKVPIRTFYEGDDHK